MSTTNQTFTIKRFSLYLKKYLGENGRQLLLFCGITGAIMLAISLIVSYTHMSDAEWVYTNSSDVFDGPGRYRQSSFHSTQWVWLVTVAFAAIILSASRMFAVYSSKESRLCQLTNPSTRLEKYTALWLIHIPGVWIVAIALYCITLYVNYFLMDIFTDYGAFYRPVALFPDDHLWDGKLTVFKACVIITLFIQSFFALGSAVWPKGAWPKTIGVGFILFGGMIFIAVSTVLHLTKGAAAFGIPPYPFSTPTPYIALAIIMTVVNFTIAYFRMKEAEVISRW